MKLSVIIPVYHVEATLDRCVTSVLRQDVADMEVILVDDGSPDRCPQMCDEWAKKDARIQVIHKANGGLSDARNAALDMAKGNFVTFVDSDDYLDDGTYAPLLSKMEGIDILEYAIADKLSLEDRFYDDVNTYWLESQAYNHTFACNKLYRRELFSNIRFPKGRVFEDAYTFPLLLKSAHNVRTTSQKGYHYCDNPQGITARADGSQLALLLEAHLNNNMPVDDTYYLRLANIQADVWEQTGQPIILPPRQVNHCLFKGSKKLKAITLNILGIRNLCRILKCIHYFRKPNRS